MHPLAIKARGETHEGERERQRKEKKNRGGRKQGGESRQRGEVTLRRK
jgi:hypothetical protein